MNQTQSSSISNGTVLATTAVAGARAAAKIATALERITKGNLSNVDPVGEGVSEYKIDWGPGYRINFGKDGARLVILVGGGSKKRQPADIAAAKERWTEYKRRKKKGEK